MGNVEERAAQNGIEDGIVSVLDIYTTADTRTRWKLGGKSNIEALVFTHTHNNVKNTVIALQLLVEHLLWVLVEIRCSQDFVWSCACIAYISQVRAKTCISLQVISLRAKS